MGGSAYAWVSKIRPSALREVESNVILETVGGVR